MHIDRGNLVVSVHTDLSTAVISAMKTQILNQIQSKHLRGLAVDLSEVRLLDQHQAQQLFALDETARLLGATSVFSGIRAGVAVALIELGFEPGDLKTSVSLADAIALLPQPEVDQGLEQCVLKDEDNKETALATGGAATDLRTAT